MKFLTYFSLLTFLFSCNTHTNESATNATQTISNADEIINSVKNEKGKYTVDNLTAEYIHRLENTVINFRDMAKKRKPGIAIYKEFSEILTREMLSLNANFYMKGEGENVLRKILDKISEQNKTIAGNDLEQAKSSFKNVCYLTDQINSNFDYNN